jgi:hypothetical protein
MEKKKKSKSSGKKSGTKKSSVPKYLFIGLTLLALSAGAYVGVKMYRRRKQQSTYDTTTTSSTSTSAGGKSGSIVWRDDSFPLSVGSSGPRVLQLQRKLNAKSGAKLEQDGLFGPLTNGAVLKAGYSVPLTEEVFNSITDGEATLVFDPRSIADRVLKFSKVKDLKGTLVALGEMKSVDHYKSVNFYFQILTLADKSIAVRRTLVTHLLSHAFLNESDANKQRITDEFSRMGLIERDGKWSLSGLRNLKGLVTIRDTLVRDGMGNRIRVKKGTLLGKELYSSGPLTTFIAMDGTKGLVPSTHVRHYKK